MLNNLIIIRNIFYRLFVIGIAYTMVVFVIYLSFQGFYLQIMHSMLNLSDRDSYLLVAQAFVLIKIFLVYAPLFAALSLHWTTHSMAKTQK